MKKVIIAISISCLISLSAFAQSSKLKYYGDVEMGDQILISNGWKGNAISLNTTHGCSFINNTLIAGIGVGYMYSLTNEDSFLPLYLEGKYRFTDEYHTLFVPFVSLRFGGQLDLSRVDNAFTVSPAIGCEISNLFIRAGFQFIDGGTQVDNGRIYYNDNYHYYSVVFSVGVHF